MNGIFKRKYFWNIVSLLCSFLLIGLFIFIGYVDSEVSSLIELLPGIIPGAIGCVISLVYLLYNFKAYMHIYDGHIKGKYHFFGKVDCKLSDVEFALARINTLIIQLKNGKCHTITGIENSHILASEIRSKMPFDLTKKPEVLIERLNKIKSAKRKELLYVCSFTALMFVNIFITVFLTDGKDLDKFNSFDWGIFAVMAVTEIATIIATFYFAQKTGKNNIPIEKLQYEIKRITIETKPLLYGKVIKVFTDTDYSARLILFGYHNEDSVYYAIQEFEADYNLIKVYESELYENIESVSDDFKNLLDITEKFIH